MYSLPLVEVVAAPLVVRHCHVRVLLHSILEILEGRRRGNMREMGALVYGEEGEVASRRGDYE